jgi:tellurite methyltransferase
VLALLPGAGVALDVAAGRGRHTVALARRGFNVIAADYSATAIRTLADAVNEARLGKRVWPVVADMTKFALKPRCVDVIVNINFLLRPLIELFKRALKPEGYLLFESFLIDQAALGHPANPDFLLGHYELRALLADFQLLVYREGLMMYGDGTQAWRAGALARWGG